MFVTSVYLAINNIVSADPCALSTSAPFSCPFRKRRRCRRNWPKGRKPLTFNVTPHMYSTRLDPSLPFPPHGAFAPHLLLFFFHSQHHAKIRSWASLQVTPTAIRMETGNTTRCTTMGESDRRRWWGMEGWGGRGDGGGRGGHLLLVLVFFIIYHALLSRRSAKGRGGGG